MFLLSKPSDDYIRGFIAAQCDLPFSYPEVGASRTGAPAGYPINHHRAELGTGAATFEAAADALRLWRMYELDWTKLCWPDTPPTEGNVVAIRARHWAFWSLNACRVVYSLDDDGPVRRRGFAFGTLPSHSEQGEERFTVEWDHETDTVWYELLAFAKPKHVFAKLGYPIARRTQKRFARESAGAMIAAVRKNR